MLDMSTRRKSKLDSEFVTVSPDVAAAWLEANTHNRTMSRGIVEKYARDMANGKWRLTGDAIRFDTEKRLIDGQHRLAACVKAGKPFDTLVIYGVSPEDQEFVDLGKSRNATDVLTLRGLQSSHRLSSALRMILAYRDEAVANRGMQYPVSEITACLERHPNITKSVTAVSKLPKTTPMAALTFVHYAASILMRKRSAADAMIDVFKSGIPSYDGDAMHMMREKLIASQTGSANVTNRSAAWTLFYCWNSFAKREAIGVLRWQTRPVDIVGLDRKVL